MFKSFRIENQNLDQFRPREVEEQERTSLVIRQRSPCIYTETSLSSLKYHSVPTPDSDLIVVDMCAFPQSSAQHVISAGPDRNESLHWRRTAFHHIRPPLPGITRLRIDLQTVIPRVLLFVQNCTEMRWFIHRN
ncbi:uncharacterized protein BDZ83DRAFT_297375 [Colletotrichum acutatum]|uniref:Uncharacterized protein n=1 Tax=Glomerella acutata TaxID=27357 RepID=A0AAD9D2S7_GLOAC|nr:uncharacterized protein BDZ83DRAFT_297375 [Colletotrichum acutatum]KAK1731109.1 hypothetical protein BDZ83DRAFT_297375 [Colletotrichum acutatum]